MKRSLLIWVTMLALALVMSFSTVLSFAEGEDPANPVQKTDLADCTVTWDEVCDFNDGNPVEPEVTVALPDGKDVPEDSNYEVACNDNTAATQAAIITVTAKDDSTLITGMVDGTFAIVYPMSKYAKVTLSKTVFPLKLQKNDNWKVIPAAQKPSVTVTGYAGAALKNGQDYSVKYSNPSSKNAGSYSVTVTAKTGSDYTGALTATYKISPMSLNDDFYLYGPGKYYNGKKLKPKKVTVGYYNNKTSLDVDLVKGTHYTVVKGPTYSNNKKIGYANIKMTIKGKGNFTGTKVLYGSFTIAPGKATIKSIKGGKKKITVKWKKVKNADGYAISYFGWKGSKDTGDKTIYVKGKSKVSKTIKKLKSGYTYDVWVSAYKKVNGEKVFLWANPKTVKVK